MGRVLPLDHDAEGRTLDRVVTAAGSEVRLAVTDPLPEADECLDRAASIILETAAACSRFDPSSALVRVNAEPDTWHDVPEVLALAVNAAEAGHRATGGAFDPRVLGTSRSWGYDHNLPVADGLKLEGRDLATPEHHHHRDEVPTEPWTPLVRHDAAGWRVHIGGRPIDLGGVGKGLAIGWAAGAIAGQGSGWMVDAAGDGVVAGRAPRGGLWRLGVSDPGGGPDPLLVLEISETAYATSSTRLRRWRSDGTVVHHLVDPVTQRPAGAGLLSVSTLAREPVWAEVWGQALFLAGVDGIRARADSLDVAAVWVETDGTLGMTPAMASRVVWQRGDVQLNP